MENQSTKEKSNDPNENASTRSERMSVQSVESYSISMRELYGDMNKEHRESACPGNSVLADLFTGQLLNHESNLHKSSLHMSTSCQNGH